MTSIDDKKRSRGELLMENNRELFRYIPKDQFLVEEVKDLLTKHGIEPTNEHALRITKIIEDMRE